MPYHTIDSMNWRPKDDAVIPRWVTIKNGAGGTLPKWKIYRVVHCIAYYILLPSIIYGLLVCIGAVAY